MSQIFAFGDSITWGCWDLNGGWADLLKKEIVQYLDSLPEEREIIFYNLGIPSNRTDQLVKRFSFEVDQRFDEDNQERYFIFAFGTNDAAFKIKEQVFRLDISQYEANVRKTIELAKGYSGNIVFLNITPVDESKTNGVLNKSKSRKNEYIDKYNEVLLKICRERGVDLIDINSEFKKNDYIKLLYDDGLHPNSEGHQVILGLVRDYLASKKQIVIT